MSWPTPQDYNEAIQNPRTCFGDEELRAGTPELTPLGLPKPISGAFASVYQMNCASGRWAVRCFLREVSDHQARYQAISEHLQRVKLPSTVGFEFLSQGIRIRGTWYPILKMEWIDGEPLNSYIERNLANPAALSSLTDQWRETLAALRQAEVAHGDLQHGNVLVSQGRIRLIDYDGMYVPALAGLVSHEEGHRNYQHPARGGKDFGLHLDAFSGWVVLLSLVALGVDPRLWQRLNAGDECLLLRRDDFENPARSKAFQAILAARTPDLRFLARQVQSFLGLPAAQVPALDTIALTLPDSRQRSAPLPDWLAHNRQAGPSDDVPALPSLDDGEAGWEQPPSEAAIAQVIESAGQLELWEQTDFTGERVAAATTLAVILFLGIGALVSFVPGWLPLVVGSVLTTAVAFLLVVGYRSHPYHARRRAAVQKQIAIKQQLRQAESQIQQLRDDFRHATAEIRSRRQAYYALHAALRMALVEIDARHAAGRADCEREIRALEDRELDALDEIGWRLQKTASATTKKLNQSHVDEQAELAEALTAPLVRGAILSKYESLRQTLTAQQESAERRLALRRKNTSDDYAARRAAVDKTSISLDDQHDREYANACSDFERDRQRLSAEFNELWPAAAAGLDQFKANRRKLSMNSNSAWGDLLRVQKQQAQLAALTFAAYLKRVAGM